jgi:hypothetical protein
MEPGSSPSAALPLLAQLYRERRSGLLRLGPDDAPVRVLLRDGHVVGLGPVARSQPASGPALPCPDDSAQTRLERVLVEVGIRPPLRRAPAPAAAPAGDARERLVRALADGAATATFAEGVGDAPEAAETAGATEPLILEAVQAIRDPEEVRWGLGDLDRSLSVNLDLAQERTLTLTEGYILSRIDGAASAREILQLVPLDPGESERTLLGLLLTGRVEYLAAPARPRRLEAVAPPPEEPQPVAEDVFAPGEPAVPREEDFPLVSLVEDVDVDPVPEAELDPETRERREEIAQVFQTLHSKNHFEVLDVEPGCTDAEVKRAYASLVKRFHPDANGDPRLETILAAILMRAREAFEVLGTASSRAQYEAKSGIVRRPREASPAPEPRPSHDWPFVAAAAHPPLAPAPTASRPAAQPPPAPAAAASRPAAPHVPDYVPTEEILARARILLSKARYWDVIQVLELAVPLMEPRRAQHKARILLAKAYAKNPKWVRRAFEYIDHVVREDPSYAEAHYQLGQLHKQVGQPSRAQAAFRRVLELKPEHREAAAELGLDTGRPAPGLLRRLFGKGKAS